MKKLLYLEDDELAGSLTNEILKVNGIETEWVKDGVSAIKAMRERTFGLILSDYDFPDSEKWREFLRDCDTPLIWFTGHRRDEVEKPACMIDHIQKPADFLKLVETIKMKLGDTISKSIQFKSLTK